MKTKFQYLKDMLQEGGYEFSRYITEVPLESKNIAMDPYQHRLSGTSYYVIRHPHVYGLHLSIFENEFNDNKFHITLDKSKNRMTYAWDKSKNDFVPIGYTGNDNALMYFHPTYSQNLIDIYKQVLASLYKYILETSDNQYGGGGGGSKKKYKLVKN